MNCDTLRAVPIFESLDDESARALCDLLTMEEYEAGQVLFRAGDAGDSMYLIEDGKVQISMRAADGEELILAILGPGDFFGEMALFDRKPRSANAVVMETTRLGILSRPHFLSFLSSSADVAVEMLTALTRRLRRTDELLRYLATRNVNEEEASRLTFADRAADVIAEFGGSWKFIILTLVLFGIWMAANVWMLTRPAFDPYPFTFLNLILGIMAALQAPIIMMSQNREAKKDRLRADLDYRVNLKNELALNEILRRLHVLEQEAARPKPGKQQPREQQSPEFASRG